MRRSTYMNNEIIRGQRAKIIPNMDFLRDSKILDEVIEPYINKNHNTDFEDNDRIVYVSSAYYKHKKREYLGLYRAKTPYGKWVYGCLIVAGEYCCILESEDKVHSMDYPYLDHEIGTFDGKATPVLFETIGQFIGLYDNKCTEEYIKGQPIFEGDFVNVWWSDKTGEPHCCENYLIDDIRTTSVNGWLEFANKLEVVGNIHDNPDLLNN